MKQKILNRIKQPTSVAALAFAVYVIVTGDFSADGIQNILALLAALGIVVLPERDDRLDNRAVSMDADVEALTKMLRDRHS